MDDPDRRNTLTWNSITVLPPLVVAVAVTMVLVARCHELSFHTGLGVFVGGLAIGEIGYLLFLIAANWRDGSVHPSRER